MCIIKFSILALYHRIFGLSWVGWFCVALTTGYLITNHVVLPLYTKPLDYYWNQWYGAKGVVQVDEAKVSVSGNAIRALVDSLTVLPWCWYHQSLRRHLHLDCAHLQRPTVAT